MKSEPPLLMLAEGRRPRPRKAAAPRQSELSLHIAVADLLRRFCRPTWLWWHSANGEHRDPRTAAKLKAMGVRPGVPDLVLISPAGVLHALEMKAPGGRLSEAQEAFRLHCIGRGIAFVTASSMDDALLAFRTWDCLTHEIEGHHEA